MPPTTPTPSDPRRRRSRRWWSGRGGDTLTEEAAAAEEPTGGEGRSLLGRRGRPRWGDRPVSTAAEGGERRGPDLDGDVDLDDQQREEGSGCRAPTVRPSGQNLRKPTDQPSLAGGSAYCSPGRRWCRVDVRSVRTLRKPTDQPPGSGIPNTKLSNRESPDRSDSSLQRGQTEIQPSLGWPRKPAIMVGLSEP